MSVIRRSGTTKLKRVVNATSAAYAANSLVTANGSGAFIPSTSSSVTIKGICLEAITSSDARYSTAGTFLIDEINPDDVFEMTVTGTFTAAYVGKFMDLSDAVTVNAAATAVDIVECVGYISSTKGLFKINGNSATKTAVGGTS